VTALYCAELQLCIYHPFLFYPSILCHTVTELCLVIILARAHRSSLTWIPRNDHDRGKKNGVNEFEPVPLCCRKKIYIDSHTVAQSYVLRHLRRMAGPNTLSKWEKKASDNGATAAWTLFEAAKSCLYVYIYTPGRKKEQQMVYKHIPRAAHISSLFNRSAKRYIILNELKN